MSWVICYTIVIPATAVCDGDDAGVCDTRCNI